MAQRWRLLPDDPEIGWVPYIFVLYVGFVFLTPVLGELTGARMWGMSAAATAAFVPLFFLGYRVHGRRRLGVALAIGLLGTALAPLNPGASTFFAYAAYFAGLSHEEPRESLRAVGMVLALALLTAVALSPTVYFTAPAVLGVAVLGPLGAHFARRHVEIAELRMARAEVEALARIAERDRIAGDLHDLLGHTLSVIVLKSELTRALAHKDIERAAKEAQETETIARKALTEVRTAVRGYRVGSGAGLREELANAIAALRTADVEAILEATIERIAARLDPTHEGVLALALREATTNILRHAGARRCWIAFFDEGTHYGLRIRDDGRGLSGRDGCGLQGMRRRIEALGGRLETDNDGGASLTIELPSCPRRQAA